MVAADEDALVCDFAETYHIYDWRGLPARYAAVLACGFRDDSRIMMAMRKQKISTEMMHNAAKVDALNLLVWMQTKDGAKNRNRPQSIMAHLSGMAKTDSDKIAAFDTVAAFEARRKELLEGVTSCPVAE